MRLEEYIRLSLELHLFFDRIMKEHSFFIEASLSMKNNDLKQLANHFQKQFGTILKEIVQVANGKISRNFLLSEEILTNKTLQAERKSSDLTGILIDTSITKDELNLQTGMIQATGPILDVISNLNRRSLTLLRDFISFQQENLNKVVTCKLFTTNYPLMLEHLIEEATLYFEMLNKLERRETFTNTYLYERELFWNEIMKEHAEFMRGLFDPSERNLILTADKFALHYEDILKKYQNNILSFTKENLKETLLFQKFKVQGEEGILNCQLKSIIIPLLADHVTREANHFIRLLRSFNINVK